MTVLIAWGSLSVGIVMGAMWRSLCERQSRSKTDMLDGSLNLHRLSVSPDRWQRQHGRMESRHRSA
jgi:hypothetical protein